MASAAIPALSGDVQGMASSNPAANMGEEPPLKLPKGNAPAAAPVVDDSTPAPSRDPASAAPPAPAANDEVNPFDDTQKPGGAQAAAADANPFDSTGSPAGAPVDEPNPFDDKPTAAALHTPAAASTMRSVIDTNLAAHNAAKPKPVPGMDTSVATPLENGDFVHDLLGGLGMGLQGSSAGLMFNGKMPDHIPPEHADMAMHIASMIGQFAGDLPAMIAGGLGGAVAGTAVGGAVGNLPGAITGFGYGGVSGGFALPAAIRKMYVDHYTRGDISASENPAREFAARLMATSWEAIKGAVTGAAGKGASAIAEPVAGALASKGAELIAMTTVASGLEGQLPHPQDFADGAFLMAGLHGIDHVTKAVLPNPADKLQNIYAATGEAPHEIIEAAKTDVILKQDLVAGNMQEPVQASPTEMMHEHVTEPAATEGEAPKIIGTKTELVPKGPEPIPEEKPSPPTDLESLTAEAEAITNTLSKIGENEKAPTTFGKIKKALDAGDKALALEHAVKPFNDGFDSLYAKNVDKTDPIARAMADAVKEGASIDPEKNPHMLARVLPAHVDEVRQILKHGFQDAEGNSTSEGFDQIMADMPEGSTRQEYTAYMMAKQAKDMSAKGVQPWEKFDSKQNDLVIKALGPKYEEINQRRVQFANAGVDYAVSKELLSPEAADKIKKAYENYSPSARAQEWDEFNDANNFGQGGNPFKRLKGDDAPILDPLIQTLKNTENLVRAAKINEARASMVRLLSEGKLVGQGKEGENPAELWLQKVPSVQFLGTATGDVSTDGRPIMTTPALKPNEFAVRINGERHVYTGDPLLVQSMKLLDGDKTAMDSVMKVARSFSQLTRFGTVDNPITGWPFAIAHGIRAQSLAWVQSRSTNFLPIHSLLSLKEFMGQSSDVYQEWQRAGGAAGTMTRIDESHMLEKGVFDSPKAASIWGSAWNTTKNILTSQEAFIKATDNLARFTEYKLSREQGVGKLESAMRSRNVVTDYQMAGLQRSILRTGIAFSSAHINSMANMATQMSENPAGVFTKLAVMSFMSAGLWAVNKDDEAIQSRPDWESNSNWLVNLSRFSPDYKSGDKATIVKIPKPWAPGVLFATGAEFALNKFFTDNPQSFAHFAKALTESIVPPVIPNIAQPILDQYANRNSYTGRPLVSEYQKNLLPEMKYQPYTSETAKGIAKIIGYVPLVKTLGPSLDPLASPAVVENYVRVWGGSLGGYALKLADYAGRGFKPDIRGNTPLEDNPFYHRFIAHFPDFQDQRITDFYANRDAAEMAYHSQRAAAKAGDFEAAKRIQEEHPEFANRLTGIAKGISEARKGYEATLENPNYSDSEKSQLTNTFLFQMGSMAKMGNQMMSDFHKRLPQNTEKGN